MKKKLLLINLLLFASLIFPEKAAVLPEIKSPAFDIVVDNNELFMVECATIFIYSLENFKLKKKFGRRGEGPREFKVHPAEHVGLSVQPDSLLVQSGGKMSFFTRDGEFKKEISRIIGFAALTPLDNNYVAYSRKIIDNTNYRLISLLDANFKKIKEVCRSEHNIRKNKIELLWGTFHFKIYNNHIYVVYSEGDFVIDCFDKNGNFKFSIKDEKFPKRKASAKDKKRIHDWYRINLKGWYHKNKQRMRVDDYWPAIGTFFIDNDIIYIGTYLRQEENWIFYLYGIKGNFIKTLSLPLFDRHLWAPYPYYIKNGKLYQVLENEDTETWELHITEIQ